MLFFLVFFFFFQAEDGIRDAQESRGLGDVYKRQIDQSSPTVRPSRWVWARRRPTGPERPVSPIARFTGTPLVLSPARPPVPVSYTHLRAHETPEHLVCRLLLEKKKTKMTHSSTS